MILYFKWEQLISMLTVRRKFGRKWKQKENGQFLSFDQKNLNITYVYLLTNVKNESTRVFSKLYCRWFSTDNFWLRKALVYF